MLQSRWRWWPLTGALWFAAGPAVAQSSFARGAPLQWPSVLTGAFLGFLLLPAAYNIAFFTVLRERFLLWQTGRVMALAALTVSLSSLPLGPWLAGDSFARQVLINLLFDTSIAIAGPFLIALLEPGMIGARLRWLLARQPWLIALTTPARLLDPCPAPYMALRNAVLVGVLGLVCVCLAQAIARGSRAARYQAAAWSCLALVYAVSLYHDIVLGRPFGLFLYALFAALSLEMVLTTVGIGDRFMRLKRQHDEARSRTSALEIMAHTDSLTGLGNRRSLEIRFAERRPRALAVFDIDSFKQINDRFGHDCGDQVIVAVAAALQTGDTFAARIGGEEFALLLYADQPLAEAERLLRQIPHRVARDLEALDPPVTASAGIAILGSHTSLSEALKVADARLYEAKSGGRNRIVGPDGASGSFSAVA